MTQDEALKLALEALERCVATCFDQYAHEQVMGRPEHFVNQTITAIKEALAQPAYRAVKTFHEGIEAGRLAEREAIAKEFDRRAVYADGTNSSGWYNPDEPAQIIRARGNI